jgi:hypothetical protein
MTAMLARAAVAFGVMRAVGMRGDRFRRARRLFGAMVPPGIAWLAARDAFATIARGTAPETTIEAWGSLAVGAGPAPEAIDAALDAADRALRAATRQGRDRERVAA